MYSNYKDRIFILLIVYFFITSILFLLFMFRKIFVAIIIGIMTITLIKNIQYLKTYLYSIIKKEKNYTYSSIVMLLLKLFLIISFFISILLIFIKIGLVIKYIFYSFKLNYITQIINIIIQKFKELIFEKQIEFINYEIFKNYMKYVFEQSYVFIFTTRGKLSEIISTIFTIILSLPFITYFYFKNRNKYLNSFLTLFEENNKNYLKKIIVDLFYNFYLFITKKYIEFYISLIIFTIIFYIVDLPYYLSFSLYLSLWTVAIPNIGIITGLIIIIFISYIYSYKMAIYIIINVFLINIINFFLIRQLIPKKIQIDLLLTLILLFVTWKLFGFFYMIFSIPIYLIYKIIFYSIILDN